MYFFWFFVVGNCRNLTLDDVKLFPIGEPSTQVLDSTVRLFDQLMKSYRSNSAIKTRGETEFQEFNWAASKTIVDRIDQMLATHYSFTDKEVDFIVNYDIKIRMGSDLYYDDYEEEDYE